MKPRLYDLYIKDEVYDVQTYVEWLEERVEKLEVYNEMLKDSRSDTLCRVNVLIASPEESIFKDRDN